MSAPASVVFTHLRPTWGGGWWLTGRSSQLEAVGCDVGASSPWERRGGPPRCRGGFKSAFLWRLDTVSLGKHQRNGVERQDRATTPSQRICAHVQGKDKWEPSFALCTRAPFYWAIDCAGPAHSTPFLCSCAKKRGGAPKKRAFGGRRKRKPTVTPAQLTYRAKRP